MSAFLPTVLKLSWQEFGVAIGAALMAISIIGGGWQGINEWREKHNHQKLNPLAPIIGCRDWISEWTKKPRLNPALSVIIFLIGTATVGAWLNYGRLPIDVTTKTETAEHKQPVVYVEVGSVVWAYEETFTIWSTAQEIYSETRRTFAANLAEADNASDDQILLWYCYAIINSIEVWGKRPPSTRFEPLDLRGYMLKQGTTYGHYLDAPIPGTSASYVDLRIKRDALHTLAEKIGAINSKPAWHLRY